VQHFQEIVGQGSTRKYSATHLHSVSAGVSNGAHWGKAQRDLDLRPDRYTHYYRNEFPERFHPLMDTRRWGLGERLVFEPYTKVAREETFDWISRQGIFAAGAMGHGRYEDSVLSLEMAG
jgi:hypothetical protein